MVVQRKFRLRRRLLGLAATPVAIGVVVAAGAVDAATGDADAVNGCYHDTTGAVRILEGSGAACRPNEVPIVWSKTGPPGPAGPAGSPGVSGYVRVTGFAEASGVDVKSATAVCPAGTRVLSGGAIIGAPPGHHQLGVFISDDFPVPNSEAWTVGAMESVENGAVWGLSVFAICAKVAT